MLIGFIGDVHGCVHHCLAAIYKVHSEMPLDLIIQVGDLGAWPDVETMFEQDPPSRWFADDNPRTLDWFELLDSNSPNRDLFVNARSKLGQPILMVRGNHDDPAWLRPGCVDAFDLFHFVPDGTVMRIDGLKIGFLGGIEIDESWPDAVVRQAMVHDIDQEALSRLSRADLDVLVTHDGPYGIATNWRGDTQGSKLITRLVKDARPKWHIAGHYHHLIGPKYDGLSSYIGLSCLVLPLTAKWDASARDSTGCVQASAIVVLDTEKGTLSFPSAETMQPLDKDLELASVFG